MQENRKNGHYPANNLVTFSYSFQAWPLLLHACLWRNLLQQAHWQHVYCKH